MSYSCVNTVLPGWSYPAENGMAETGTDDEVSASQKEK
jgi:hypothetical protein